MPADCAVLAVNISESIETDVAMPLFIAASPIIDARMFYSSSRATSEIFLSLSHGHITSRPRAASISGAAVAFVGERAALDESHG
jgi:hypothetical protein